MDRADGVAAATRDEPGVAAMAALDLEPYPAYKDSGVEWLGKVPAHWDVRRASSRLRVVNRPIHPREMCQNQIFHYSIPNVQRHGGGRCEATSSVASGKILVDRESLLVSRLNPRKATIALAVPHPTLVTIASGEFVAMEPRACLGIFAKYVYASESVRQELSSRVNSATKSHQRCTPEDIAKLRIPWPRADEQTAIARFLDYADRRIQRYIRAKERLIELLEEERQATVHEAVTGRIDVRTGQPYPAYKDSGVEWLGKVPAHWEVRRGKTVFRCIDERSETGTEELLTVSSDRGIVPRDSASVTMFKARSYVGHKLCWPGDLVINSLWAWSRGLGISRYHGIVSTAYGVYRVRRKAKALPDFIHSLVRSEAFNWELRVRSKGIWISRLQLTDDSFLRAPLPLPPLSEQTTIVRYLDTTDRRMSARRASLVRQIALHREYRTRLIADVVTGKLDVREAASKVPETDTLAVDHDRAAAIPT